jgi:hypothetical protein
VANAAILVACDGDVKQMVKKYGVSGNRSSQFSLIKITVTSKCKRHQGSEKAPHFSNMSGLIRKGRQLAECTLKSKIA